MSRVVIDDIAMLFGMTPEEALSILSDNGIVTDSITSKVLGHRFGGSALEQVGHALRSTLLSAESVAKIEIADIEKVTDLPHATVCETYGLPENARSLPVAAFHEGIDAIAQLRGCKQRAAELKWQNDARRAGCERDDAMAEVAELDHRVQELEGDLESQRAKALSEKERADSLEKRLAGKDAVISTKDRSIADYGRDVNGLKDQLEAQKSALRQAQAELNKCQNELSRTKAELNGCQKELGRTQAELDECLDELSRTQAEVLEWVSYLEEASRMIWDLEEQLKQAHQEQPSRDELNALKMNAVDFWNRWLDADVFICVGTSYTIKELAQTLSRRQQEACNTLFGAQIPSYDRLRTDAGLLNLMKQLGFGSDMHPEGYATPGLNAYYTLRYELGYAFEYYEIYRNVLETFVDVDGLSVLSIGCGQGLDYWGLRCAQAALNRRNVPMRWHGIDLESWPEPVLDDDTTFYEFDTDLLDVIEREEALNQTVVMLPKVISELPMSVIDSLAEWLIQAEFTKPVHYLCIAHTERAKLGGPFDAKNDGSDSSDAVKSAKLIRAFREGAGRQGYTNCQTISPSAATTRKGINAPKLVVRQYTVRWPNGASEAYSYLAYDTPSSSRDVVVGGIKPFDVGRQVGQYVHDIGKECCPEYVGSYNGYCTKQGIGENCPKQCPLFRWPRFKTDGMAYQIYRAERPRPKHLSTGKAPAQGSGSFDDYDEDIPF